jgi:hypothetical protein
VTVLAAIRPDSVNGPLLLHVLGALVLVGALLTASVAAIVGWRDETPLLTRLSYKTLLLVAFPAWIVMRVGAEWTYSREHLDKVYNGDDPAWLGIGYGTADTGGLLLLIALILGGVGLRRMRRGGGPTLLRVSAVLGTLILLVYVVALWAMGGKPS